MDGSWVGEGPKQGEAVSLAEGEDGRACWEATWQLGEWQRLYVARSLAQGEVNPLQPQTQSRVNLDMGKAMLSKPIPLVMYFFQQGCTTSPNHAINWEPSVQISKLMGYISQSDHHSHPRTEAFKVQDVKDKDGLHAEEEMLEGKVSQVLVAGRRSWGGRLYGLGQRL